MSPFSDTLHPSVTVNTLLIVHHASTIVRIDSLHMARHNATMSSHFFMLELNEAFWTLLGDGFFVAEDEQRCVPYEDPIDVFETAPSGFGVEKINFRGLLLVLVMDGKSLPMGMKEKLNTVQMM
jgi:hypothetical protein